MTIYWVTEAIPLPITGMIPMVAFPREYKNPLPSPSITMTIRIISSRSHEHP